MDFTLPADQSPLACQRRPCAVSMEAVESLTKPKVSDGQIRAIAEKHLGAPSERIAELKDGWFNAAYMLTQPDGREFVLKIAPPPTVKLMRYEENILEVEVETMRLMAEKTQLPVPRIVAYDATCGVVPSGFFLMDRLPGVPFNHVRAEMAEEKQRPIHEEVGRCLRTMHEITHSTFGLYNRPVHRTWRAAVTEMFDMLRLDGEEVGAVYPDGAFEAADKLYPYVEVIQTASFVHWDLWDGNIFVEDGKMTGIIDFERAFWGDPLMEGTFMEPRPGMMEGYGMDLFATPNARERRLLYDLYLFLVMVIESRFRGFTQEHEQWPRMKLDETLQAIQGI